MYVRTVKKLILIGLIASAVTLMTFCIACTVQPLKMPEPVTRPSVPPPPALPVIAEFISTRSSVYPGAYVDLKWDVSGATSVTIQPNIGQVGMAGTKAIRVWDNITYTMTGINEYGSVSQSTTIYACPTCGCLFTPNLAKIKGYEVYVDHINCFELRYPSLWIIDRKRFSDLNAQAGGVLSGVSLSNNKPGSDYSYCDVVLEVKGPDLDKRAFADQYKKEQLAKGYTLVFEDTRSMADDKTGIEQKYEYISSDRKYDHGAFFEIHDGKFWITMYGWPHDMRQGAIIGSFSLLR